MKTFITKIIVYTFLMFILLEVVCRVFVDSYFFGAIDIYNTGKVKNNCIFIGSSRVPATIDATVFSKYDQNCLVAGRGYVTGGIHLTALQYNLKKNPDYLRNVNVFIEYPGKLVFAEDAGKYQYYVFEPKSTKYDPAMPHFIVPYLTLKTLKSFLADSPNSLSVKINLVFLYFSSAYRCILFLQEKEPINKILKKAVKSASGPKNQLTTSGGIKNKNFNRARRKAIELAREDSIEFSKSKIITGAELNNSILANIFSLVKNNGGNFYLYRIPMHTLQKNVTLSERASLNKHIFEEWLREKHISIISTDKFQYTNNDFPDTWHLSINRREEFSSLLISELVHQNIIPFNNKAKN